MDVLDPKATGDKRKKKEQRRREIKLQRKNRIHEKAHQTQIQKGDPAAVEGQDPQKLKEKLIAKKREDSNKALLSEEVVQKLSFGQKIALVKSLKSDIIAFPSFSYHKLKDLLTLCADSSLDVVVKATNGLCDIFTDILPDYRIRQLGGDDKHEKVSKDVQQLRDQEQTLLLHYKEYLQVLETFSKLKSHKLTKDEKQVAQYDLLKSNAIDCFCRLLTRHPHFNFRMNILETVVLKLSSQDLKLRRETTQTLKDLLKKDDNQLLEFKLDIIRALHKALKNKSHDLFDPNLLECLVLHEIMVDESKARAVDQSSKKSQQLHDQLQKLRKKGKFKEYKEMRDQLVSELKETDAIGIDLGKVSKTNNEIIKETLAIYFEILKSPKGSPLLRSVFLGMAQFTKYVNIEIVWDLINVLREFFKVELQEAKTSSRDQSVSNILAGLLCAFQIMEVGAGTVFNVEEKDFTTALYTVIQRFYEQPRSPKIEYKDFLTLLKCLDMVFISKKQLSAELVNAFVKRLAILQMHMLPQYQASLLFLLKQILNKYPSARSSMLEIEDDSVEGGFGITPRTAMYKASINDPQLSNAGKTHILFELIQTQQQWQTYSQFLKQDNIGIANTIQKLIKSMLQSESVPQELLTTSPSLLLAKLNDQTQKTRHFVVKE